jgi:HEAT repeat protein
MKRLGNLLTVLACLVASLVVAAVAPPTTNPEPRYAGRALSELVHAYAALSVAQRPETAVVSNAIVQIGPDAVPYLLKWLSYVPPSERTISDPAEERATDAMLAFHCLGPKALTALPSLVSMMQQPTNRVLAQRAMYALGELGPKALPPLLAAATNATMDTEYRGMAMTGISELGTNARPAIPVLIGLLSETNPPLNLSIFIALGDLKLEPQLVVPVWEQILQSTNLTMQWMATDYLGAYGEQARSVVPALQRALRSPDSILRDSAAKALRQITPKALTNTPPARAGVRAPSDKK